MFVIEECISIKICKKEPRFLLFIVAFTYVTFSYSYEIPEKKKLIWSLKWDRQKCPLLDRLA